MTVAMLQGSLPGEAWKTLQREQEFIHVDCDLDRNEDGCLNQLSTCAQNCRNTNQSRTMGMENCLTACIAGIDQCINYCGGVN